ncbi:MAG TPA: hypothetical protein DCY85_00570 [Firmicutes bacterium]|nr:hypothetical protein [Bacillota bacterium]
MIRQRRPTTPPCRRNLHDPGIAVSFERRRNIVIACVLYVYSCAVYYASNERHDQEKLKWWNWKD